jgi:chromate transporter
MFFSFLKIGMFGFGGGYAMIPFIQREVVVNNTYTTYNKCICITCKRVIC